MGNITAEQLEALETMAEFNERLLKNLPTLITELSGYRQPDTEQYQNQDKVRVDKEDFNGKVIALNSALSSKEDSEIADALKALVPCFEELGDAIQEILN